MTRPRRGRSSFRRGDAETSQASLTYNLRVGTSPGAGDVMPLASDAATGLREVPAMGNVQQDTWYFAARTSRPAACC
jgi:hypothetical protein